MLSTDGTPKISQQFMRVEEMIGVISDYISVNLSKHDAEKYLNVREIALNLFDDLEDAGVIRSKITPVSGSYVQFDHKKFTNFRVNYLNDSSIHTVAKEIGGRFYPDTFAALESEIAQGRIRPETGEAETVEEKGIASTEVPQQAFEIISSVSGRENFVSLIDDALVEIDTAKLTNDEKAQARSYLLAARNLTEQSDPPVDLIWRIISRASDISGIASFFLSIAVFLSAAGS